MNEPDQPVPSVKEKTRGNPFSHKIRECVLACISKNVPMQNISDVIGNICKIFNVEEIDTLPSVASVHNISREAKAICNKQLEEAIKHSDNLTIMKDATTKQGRQLYGAKKNCSTGEFTLGLKEISSGTADKYVKATLDMVNEASTTTEFVGKLTNCMTDRSATELKSNKLLSELKTEELPNDSELNEFQCSVHPLLQFADEVEKVAKEIEKKYDVKFKSHPSEISTFNMAVLKPLVAYSTVIECLGQMALSILSKCRNFFTNYLPGGKYHNPSLKTINESSTCPSNNISLERMMGQLDRQKNHFTQHKFDDNKCKVDVEKQQDNGMARGKKNEEDKSIIMTQARKDAEILKENLLQMT
ncbi:unnamed protein product [Mytilus coruscus]|uniref:Uncharacterized protein n=1 Tax=Mytilus coruscus TaxID=42192 RepID=A0A6J8APE4_MYTCO|nr:unnamed protein product [Mytilus coruscus]